MDESWMAEGSCKLLRINSNLFFQVKGRHNDLTESAKRVCASCKVEEQCLEYALQNNIQDGIWGGASRVGRKQIRRLRIMLDNAS